MDKGRKHKRLSRTLGLLSILLFFFAKSSSLVSAAAPYPPSDQIESITWHDGNNGTQNTRLSAASGSDLWPNTWASDNNIYVSWGDGNGFAATSKKSFGVAKIIGNPPATLAELLNQATDVYYGPDGSGAGKFSSLVSVNGILYAWMNTQSGTPPAVKLAKSTNLGQSWQVLNLMLPSLGFGYDASFVNFGKDYQGARDNYFYIYLTPWSGQTDFWLARVPVNQIENISEYRYLQFDAQNNPMWVSDISQRSSVFHDDNGVRNTATVVYSPPLNRYFLTMSHGLGGEFGVFDAPEPWGPWTTVGYYDNWLGAGGGHGLIYGFTNKWASTDGLTQWLIWSCYDCVSQYHDRFNVIKATFTLKTPQVSLYDVYEIPLTASGSYANPYLQMPADNTTAGFVVGTFAGPTKSLENVDGFWDGGSIWKLRVACIEAGTWTYTTSSSDAGLNGKTGSFECIPSSNHGFLRVHPTNPHAFAYDDGTPVFYLGVTPHDLNRHLDNTWGYDNDIAGKNTFRERIDEYAGYGFNTMFFGTFMWIKPGNYWQDDAGNYNFLNSNPDQLNPIFWQWADERIQYTILKEFIPGLGLGWPDQGVKGSGSFTDDRLIRALRYLIARYAAYNVMWDVFGEANEYGTGWENWVDKFGKIVETYDPYDHLTSTHHTSRTAQTAITNYDWLDINIQQYSGNHATAITQDRLKGKPVVNVEFNWSDTAEVKRKSAWIIVTNGGYIQYGPEYWKNTGNPNHPPAIPDFSYMQYLGEFFRQKTQFWLLQPNNSLVTSGAAYLLENPGSEYIAYLPTGGSTTINLSAASGTLNVEWYNPKTGTYNSQTTTLGGTTQSFTAPDTQDWVLHITANPNICLGDVTQDAQRDLSDPIRCIRYLLGLDTLTGTELTAADANQDGTVDLSDVIRIIRDLLGLEPLPVCQ